MTTDLIHRRTRQEFREIASGWGILRRIEDAFEAEGFKPTATSNQTGERRTCFEEFANAIDWQDRGQVRRALRVFEEILSWRGTDDSEFRDRTLSKLRRLLDEDGYILDDQGRIREKVHHGNAGLPLDHLSDAESIREHLGRLDPTDPPLAISSAKSAIEATCKHVLEELGEQYRESDDLPALVKSVQKALKVHPDAIAPTKKGRDAIVRVLSALSQLVVGVAELRNEYGTDHGRTRSSGGLGPRHAGLAAGAAFTYCHFLLDTLEDRRPSGERTTGEG